MINWPWCFFSAQDSFQEKRDDWFWCFDSDEVYDIDGYPFLWSVVKSNVFSIRKSILMLVVFVLGAGVSVNRF